MLSQSGRQHLAERGLATPLEGTPPGSTHPHTERLTDRPGTLDQDLMTAGLSPHYGVVLAVEGDTEFIHAPGVLALTLLAHGTAFDSHRDPEAASAAIEAYQRPWVGVPTICGTRWYLLG
jgi:hypothetical protein